MGYDMARTGITYNEVAAAIDKIIAGGDDVTIMRIRETLGTGSPNTIHRYLTEWRAAQPQEQTRAVELPADLAAALTKEIERQAAEARSEIKIKLLAAQEEAAVLSKTGEETEACLDVVRDELEAKSEECLKIKSDFDRVTDMLSRTQSDLASERSLVNEMRDELALTKNRVLTLTDHVTDLKSELSSSKQEAKLARDAQVQAEKAAAVSAAQLEAEKNKNADLLARLTSASDENLALKRECKDEVDALKSELKIVRERLEAERVVSSQVPKLEESVKLYLGEIDIAQSEIDDLKETVRKLTDAQVVRS